MGGTRAIATGAVVIVSACVDGGGGGGGGCETGGYARVPCKVDSDCQQDIACVETFCDTMQGICSARGPGETLPPDRPYDCAVARCDGSKAVLVLEPNDHPPDSECAHPSCMIGSDGGPALSHGYVPDGTPCGLPGSQCRSGNCLSLPDGGRPAENDAAADADATDGATSDASHD